MPTVDLHDSLIQEGMSAFSRRSCYDAPSRGGHSMDDLERLRYPIGRFARATSPLAGEVLTQRLREIERAPAVFRSLVEGLDDSQTDMPYRPGGWTIRQVVHHVPDSHLNVYVRMKLAVTEDNPSIRVYDEQRWSELPEARSAPVPMSLDLLAALHQRWLAFLRALPEPEFAKSVLPSRSGFGGHLRECRVVRVARTTPRRSH